MNPSDSYIWLPEGWSGQSTALFLRTFATTLRSSSASNGFARKTARPASRALSTSVASSLPVIRMIGKFLTEAEQLALHGKSTHPGKVQVHHKIARP